MLAKGTILVVSLGNYKSQFSDISNAHADTNHVGNSLCEKQQEHMASNRNRHVAITRNPGKLDLIIISQHPQDLIYAVTQVVGLTRETDEEL